MGMLYATLSPERAEYWAQRRAHEDGYFGPIVVEFEVPDLDDVDDADLETYAPQVTPAARPGEVVVWTQRPIPVTDIYEIDPLDPSL